MTPFPDSVGFGAMVLGQCHTIDVNGLENNIYANSEHGIDRMGYKWGKWIPVWF